MTAHEKEVTEVMKTADSFINPWTYEGDRLVSLVSGVIASQKTTEDLLGAQQTGDAAVEAFIADRIASAKVDFFAPVKSSHISTFVQTKKKKTAQQAKTAVQCNDRSLFARLLVVSRSRQINLEEILTYPLSNVSLPLATADGNMAATQKAQLLHVVEADCKDFLLDSIAHHSSALIVDAMAMIQCIPAGAIPVTFGRLAEALLHQLCGLAKTHGAQQIHFVIDQYWEKSVKDAERCKRSGYQLVDKGQILHIANGDVKVPNKWKPFLSSGNNKANLLEFLNRYWPGCKVSSHLQLFMTSKNGCIEMKFTPDELPIIHEINDLSCDHEEADTRLIAHAIHASHSVPTVMIVSPDTDVVIMTIGHAHRFECETVAFLTGTKSRKRILNIGEMRNQLGHDTANALIGLHAFTGCDAVSSFSGKGKKTVYQLLKKSEICREAMTALGASFVVDEKLIKLCERFTCLLYGYEGTDINIARFKAFISRAGATQMMPPCHNSLIYHIQRANYVAAIWRNAHLPKISQPSPTDHGWIDKDGAYHIKWHSGEIAPPNILKTIFCACKKSHCKDGRCSCAEAGLKCTELCCCADCENVASHQQDEFDDVDADERDEDDEDEG